MRFKLFGIKFSIDYLFLVIASIALFSKNEYFLLVILFSSLHEFGHIVSLCFLGGKVDELNVSYYGIGMKYSSKLSFRREIIFLMSGILVNMFFAIFNIYRNINLALAIINALPIYPLDVGRIVKLTINRYVPYSISDKVYFTISFLFTTIFVVYSFYSKNFNYIIISAYLIVWLFRGYYD